MLFDDILKKYLISDAEYDPYCNLSLSFYVSPDILNLLVLYNVFIFFHV